MTDREAEKQAAEKTAREIWATFDDNERYGVRFGMFPAEKMKPADALGREGSHAVVVALMGMTRMIA